MARGGKRENSGPEQGTVYKKTAELRFDLMQTLKEKEFDPVAALIEVHTNAVREYKKRLNPKLNPKGFGAVGMLQIAKDSAAEIMEYVYPKRKSVELSAPGGENLFQSFTDMVKEVYLESKKNEE